ncbi:phospholipase [Exilibacterium tricleocarpae]|uniref:Phospholipase A1 n=1 Tax=Exilibacterium tricleocarpae TaxID=2591008 RepID=A0A545TS63_9GAMM|nr:phospholipase A [Exilibacterium tricleocarpae]TQV80056.1 phospholipase [Exilibacterium tricleocarpae]
MLKSLSAGLLSLYAACSFALSECRDIPDDRERLACYDDHVRPADQKSGPPPATGKKPQKKTDFSLDRMSLPTIANYFDQQKTFELTPYKANYFLPAAYNDKPNQELWELLRPGAEINNTEVKFQLSGKVKLWDDMYRGNWDLWAGYTQTAWWQLYNSDESSPFRETNYSPELSVSYYSDIDIFGFTLAQTDIGLVHQSNGRAEPLSRSWNRIYAQFNFIKGNYFISLKPWYRIPEDEDEDDNRDIDDFMGYGEYQVTYKKDKHLLSFMLRNNLRGDDNRGGAELAWAFPIKGAVKGYLQYYNGYGESLMNYNHAVNRLSLGILIFDWF